MKLNSRFSRGWARTQNVVLCGAVAAAPLIMAGSARADDETTNVTALATNVGTLETTIFPIVITAVGFGILIGVVKMVRKK